MRGRVPSLTAEHIAVHRAIEAERPEAVRVCDDPYARYFLNSGTTIVGRTWMPAKAAFSVYTYLLPGFHDFFVARTRHLDEHLLKCIEHGLEQLVILGAGYDTRAYRFGDRLGKRVKVFEVDHPATQQVKKEKLLGIFGDLPETAVFVPIDFNREDLRQTLSRHGYDPGLKTLFVWEGVTYYLDEAAIDDTLTFVTTCSGEGSSLIFDYAHQSVIDGTSRPKGATVWRHALRMIGEKLRFGIGEDGVEPFLAERGLTDVCNATSEDLKQLYFTECNAARSPSPIFSIADAMVKPRARA